MFASWPLAIDSKPENQRHRDQRLIRANSFVATGNCK
jgi:hypothetical protein